MFIGTSISIPGSGNLARTGPLATAALRSACKAFLIADKGITIGTGVSAWADQSGNGNDVSQATGLNQPALVTNWRNGKASVKGDGINDAISRATFTGGTIAQAFTIVAVHSTLDESGRFFIDSSATDRAAMGIFITAGDVAMYAGVTWVQGDSPAPVPASYSIASYNGASSNLLHVPHGAAILSTNGNPGANSMNGLTVCASYAGASGSAIDIGMVAIYNRLLTATEKTNLGNWIKSYYGIVPL